MRGVFETYRFSRLNDGHQGQSTVCQGVVYGTRTGWLMSTARALHPDRVGQSPDLTGELV